MRVEAVDVLGDEMPGPQCADEDRIVLALAGKTNVVGERRRHMQVDAAARRFPAQEVGFHLDIAIAEQQHFDALAGDAEIVKAVGGADRPIGGRPLLQVAPVAFEDFGGIAPVLGRKLGADRGQFFFRGLARSESGATAIPSPCVRRHRAARPACPAHSETKPSWRRNLRECGAARQNNRPAVLMSLSAGNRIWLIA